MRDEDSTAGAAARTSRRAAQEQPPQARPPFGPMLLMLLMFALLALAAVPAIWILVPDSYISVAGQVARGVYYRLRDCHITSEDDGEIYESSVLYLDDQGQLQETTTGSDCTTQVTNADPFVNGARADTDGASVTIRYLPGLPGTTVADGSAWGFVTWLVFEAIFLLPGLGYFLYLAGQVFRRCLRAGRYTSLALTALACLVMLVPLALAMQRWPPPTNQDHNGPTQNFHLGQTVNAEQRWAVTIQGALPAQALLTRSPDAGNLCLELEITLRNLTPQPLTLAPQQFTLYDAQIKPRSVPCALDVPRLDNATVAPGATLEGVSAYEVPASMRQFYLAFRPNPQGEENVGRYFWTILAS